MTLLPMVETSFHHIHLRKLALSLPNSFSFSDSFFFLSKFVVRSLEDLSRLAAWTTCDTAIAWEWDHRMSFLLYHTLAPLGNFGFSLFHRLNRESRSERLDGFFSIPSFSLLEKFISSLFSPFFPILMRQRFGRWFSFFEIWFHPSLSSIPLICVVVARLAIVCEWLFFKQG